MKVACPEHVRLRASACPRSGHISGHGQFTGYSFWRDLNSCTGEGFEDDRFWQIKRLTPYALDATSSMCYEGCSVGQVSTAGVAFVAGTWS